MPEGYIQVGVIGYRNPNNPEEITKTVPIYEKVTSKTEIAEEAVLTDIAKLLAQKMKQYIDGGGVIGQAGK